MLTGEEPSRRENRQTRKGFAGLKCKYYTSEEPSRRENRQFRTV
jgi:hypothetical protein